MTPILHPPISRRTVRAWVLLAGLLAVATAGPAAAQAPEAIGHYRSGYQLLQAKDFRNAAIELESAVGIDSTYFDAWYALGKAYGPLGEYGKAAQALESALRHVGDRSQYAGSIRGLLGGLYYKAGLDSRQQRRFGEAIQRFEKSLEYSPGSAQAHYTIGLCYLDLRQPDKAVPAIRAAMTADPAYAWPYKSMGDIHRQQGDLRQAAAMYQKAIDVDAKLVHAYAGLAQVRIDAGDLEGAIQTLRQAVALDAKYQEGMVLLGTCLNQLQRHGEAVAPLRTAVELDAEDPEARFRLAEALFGTGAYRDAIGAAKAAVDLKKDFHAAEVVLADAHAELGQVDEARRWYGAAQNDSRFRDYCAHRLQELDAAQAKAQGR